LMFIGWEIIYLKSPERWFSKINEFTNLRWDFTWSSPMFKRSKRKTLGISKHPWNLGDPKDSRTSVTFFWPKMMKSTYPCSLRIIPQIHINTR
jgi:hypothetical protein